MTSEDHLPLWIPHFRHLIGTLPLSVTSISLTLRTSLVYWPQFPKRTLWIRLFKPTSYSCFSFPSWIWNSYSFCTILLTRSYCEEHRTLSCLTSLLSGLRRGGPMTRFTPRLSRWIQHCYPYLSFTNQGLCKSPLFKGPYPYSKSVGSKSWNLLTCSGVSSLFFISLFFDRLVTTVPVCLM